MEQSSTQKKIGISAVVAIILVVLAAVIGVSAAQAEEGQEYPGNGVYDLTKYSACVAAGSSETENPTLLDYDFKTNSTEIRLTNNKDETITAYLYDSANISGDYSQTFELPPNRTNAFSMLTSATTYQIGVVSGNGEYALTITD